MRARWVLLIIGLALIALPASATASKTRPVVPGPAEGVQATAAGGMLEIHFTGASAALGRRLAGKRVEISCDAHPAPALAFVDRADAFTLRDAKVDADGAAVRVKNAHPGDACELDSTDDFETVARAALTPAGAVWLDEQVHATQLLDASVLVRPTTVYPSVATVAAAGGGRVVALDGPDASPSPGQVGYWTDGGTRAAYVTLSSAGRRLVLQDVGNGMERTNILEAQMTWAPLKAPEIDGSLNQSDSDGPHVHEYSGKPVRSTDGVHATIADGRLVVRFTGRSASAFRAVAGHRVVVVCTAVAPNELIGSAADGPRGSIRVVRVPRHGGVLTLRTPRAHDSCAIVDGKHFLTSVYPTALGRRWAAGVIAALTFVTNVPESLAVRGATAYPGAATIVAQDSHLTVMATPDASLKRGAIGVWTDGAQQAVVAGRAPSGRRLVLADEGGGMLRTNVVSMLTLVGALGI